jgi:Organic Anion Transporter Polypeptide (OATP) family
MNCSATTKINGDNHNPSRDVFLTNAVIPLSNESNDKNQRGGNNGLSNNNNCDDFKMDSKLNGSEKSSAEDDPLTGQRSRQVSARGAQDKIKWRQKFASTNFFMVIFLLAYVLQGCYFTYFISVLTTIEKLFHIKSATIAMLLNFSEGGQLCTSLVLTYYAGRGHRARWIACGMLLFAIASFGSVSPQFIFGDRLYRETTAAAAKGHSNFDSKNFFSLPNNTINNAEDSLDSNKLNLCVAQNNLNSNHNNNNHSTGSSSCT